MVPYLAFGTNFFPKNTTAKTPTTADRQLRHAHTETSYDAILSLSFGIVKHVVSFIQQNPKKLE